MLLRCHKLIARERSKIQRQDSQEYDVVGKQLAGRMNWQNNYKVGSLKVKIMRQLGGKAEPQEATDIGNYYRRTTPHSKKNVFFPMNWSQVRKNMVRKCDMSIINF